MSIDRHDVRSVSLENIIDYHAVGDVGWKQPDIFDLKSEADRHEVERRFHMGEIRFSIDNLPAIADDMFEMRHPDESQNPGAQLDYVDEILSQGSRYGKWVNFPWSQSLVHYPDKQDYQDLRTFRNKNLVTDVEQQVLLDSTVAVFGLSVGSSVVEQLILEGVGGTIAIGDYDRLSSTNLNRVKSTLAHVGMKKLDIEARKISEADPYIEQRHFPGGITKDGLSHLETLRPSVIYDEVDDLAAKALLRRFAQRERIPLVMATDLGDVSLIDVERHDIEQIELFNGRISEKQVRQLESGSLDPKERQRLMMKIVGTRNITPRLLDSSMETGISLGGLPQLGVTASAGGALAAVVAREIILGRRLKSGRYISSPKKILNLQSQMSLADSIKTVYRFIKK